MRFAITAPVTCALVGGVLAIAPASSAGAAAAPPPSVSLRYDALPVALPDGSLIADTAIASGGVPTGGAALQGVAADGTPSWNIPYQDQESIYPAPITDNKGNYYWVDSQVSGDRLVASHAATETWSIPITTGSIESMVVGTDGNIYTLQGNSLDAYAAADGRPLFSAVPLTGFLGGSTDQLFAYNKGVIVAAPNQVQYFDYTGNSAGGPYPLTASATAFATFAAQPNGDFFAAGMTSGVPFNGCSAPDTNTMLEKVTPSGSAWLHTLPWESRCNSYGLILNTMPDGGVVISSTTDTGHGGYQYVNAAGATGWYSETTGPAITNGSMSPYRPHVDTNGNVVAESAFEFGCNLYSDDCVGVQIDRLGPDGQPAGSPILLQGPTDVNQESWEVGSGGLALVPGRAYASLEDINGGRIFGTRSYGLYGFDMSGIGAEYPQSALWKLMPTTTGTLGINSVQITASGSDRILTRTIKFVPAGNTPIARYEYAWATSPEGSMPGSIQSCAVTLATCHLNYRPTKPGILWTLLARAIGTDGTVSSWFAKQVMTPKAPLLVVFGDSIASGHHRDSGIAPTICQDETYSYGQTIWNSLEAQIPPQWRLPHGYINVANSGFSTAQVISGGTDACGNIHPAELPIIVKRLHNNAGSWNWVVGTAGIDDTQNWPTVLTNVILVNFDGLLKTEDTCQLLVDDWKFLTDPSLSTVISGNVHTIASMIEAADPTARTYWTSYYNIAGTGPALTKIPKVCTTPFANAATALDGVLKAGLEGSQFTWVDINSVLGLHDNLLQNLYASDIIYKKSGWPHPNRKGAVKVGELVLRS